MMAKPDDFLKRLETHERVWGNETYRARPSLSEVMNAPVVVFWRSLDKRDDRSTITLHTGLEEIENYLFKLLFRTGVNPPKRTISRIFHDKKPIRIKAVRIEFTEMD